MGHAAENSRPVDAGEFAASGLRRIRDIRRWGICSLRIAGNWLLVKNQKYRLPGMNSSRGPGLLSIAVNHRRSRTPLIRRMPFPVKETFKNSLAFELFRMRFEIGNPASWI